MKRFLAFLFIGFLAQTSLLMADAIDDFERDLDEAGNKFRADVEQFLMLERTQVAPTLTELGIVGAFRHTQDGMKHHIERINSNFKEIGAESVNLSTLLTSIESHTSNLNLESYEKLLKDQSKALLAIEKIKNLNSDTAQRNEAIEHLTQGSNNLCERIKNTLEPTERKLDSAGTILERAGTPPPLPLINPEQFYSQSPLARGYSLAGGASTFALGVYAYASINNITMWQTMVKLFGIGTSNGEVLFMGNGWGAVIIMAAVVTTYVVGEEIANQENEKIRKRREKAINNLLSKIEETQAYYRANTMKKDELGQLGYKICKEEENPTKSNGQVGIIFSKISEWKQRTSEAKRNLEALSPLLTSIDKTSSSLASVASESRRLLTEKIQAEILEEHTQKVLREERVTNGWQLYNDVVKPIWTRFSAYATENSSDCANLMFEQDIRLPEIQAAKNIITLSLAGAEADSQQLARQVTQGSAMIESSIRSRVSRCQ